MTASEAGDILFDAAIKYSQGRETDFADVARVIINATLESATKIADDCADECPSLAGRVEARMIASKIRALAGELTRQTTLTKPYATP